MDYILNKPKVYNNGVSTVYSSKIDVSDNGQIKDSFVIRYTVDKKFSMYVTSDRCDSFLIAVLPMALKNKYNIYCKAPCSETLLHNLTNYLIPPLVKYNDHLNDITIESESVSDWPAGHAVGGGISLGVDSTYTINQYYNSKYSSFKLTHLCNISCSGDTFDKRSNEKMIDFSNELGVELVNITSNVLDIFKNGFYSLHHTFYNLAAVLAIGKLFRVYFYSSAGYDYAHFSFKEPPNFDSCVYDPLSTVFISTRSITIYSQGSETKRENKLEILSESPIRKHINCCWNILLTGQSCMWCDKCKRTLAVLYSKGILDKFSNSFDLEEFNRFKEIYILNAYVNKNNDYYYDSFRQISSQESFDIAYIQRIATELNVESPDPILEYAISKGSESAMRLYIQGLLRGRLGGVSIQKDTKKAYELAQELFDRTQAADNKELLIKTLNELDKTEIIRKKIVQLYSEDLTEPSKLIVAKAMDALGNRKQCISILRDCTSSENTTYLASRLKWGSEKDRAEAYQILQKLSDDNNLDARGALAIEYYEGRIVEKDTDYAIKLMKTCTTVDWCKRVLLEWLIKKGNKQSLIDAKCLCDLYPDKDVYKMYSDEINSKLAEITGPE